AARPTRASPTSTARRTPGRRPEPCPSSLLGLVSPAAPRSGLPKGLLDLGQRVRDAGGVPATPLGEVVLAAAAAADRLGSDLDQRTGLQAALTRGEVGGDHHHGTVVD